MLSDSILIAEDVTPSDWMLSSARFASFVVHRVAVSFAARKTNKQTSTPPTHHHKRFFFFLTIFKNESGGGGNILRFSIKVSDILRKRCINTPAELLMLVHDASQILINDDDQQVVGGFAISMDFKTFRSRKLRTL
jgi:hypothetical protein